MRSTTIRRAGATVGLTLAALLSGTAGTALAAIAVSVDSPLGGTLNEGQTIPAGRIAQASVDVALGHVPSTAECEQELAGLTGTVDWGDASPTQPVTATNHRNGGFNVCSIDLRAPEHRYVLARAQPYSIVVTVSHEGQTGSNSRNVQVVDAPFRGEGIPLTALAGQPLTALLGEIRDENDFSSVDQFSAVVDWGDGSTPTPATLTLDRPGRFGVVGTHTYAVAGAYLVIIRVTHEGTTVPLDPATATVVAAAGPAPGAPPALQPAAPVLSPAFAVRSSRVRLRTLRARGITLRIGLGEFTGRTVRLDVRGTRRGRVVTLGRTRLRLAGARVVDARRRLVDVRWRPSARLLRRLRLRAGRSYGLRIRFGTTTLQDTLTLVARRRPRG